MPIGNKIIKLKTVDSTNEYIKNNCLSHEEGLTVVADRQTNGKGRLGRGWESDDESSLYMSILLKPRVNAQSIPLITLMCGLAVCRAINSVCNADAKIKWPNDIIIGNKKLCGILCESKINDTGTSVIAGIGININNKSFCDSIKDKACSLYSVTNTVYDKKDVMRCVLDELDKLYVDFDQGDMSFLKEYKALCASLGRQVTFIRDGQNVTAEAVDIDDTGSLICIKDGNKYTVFHGEAAVQGIY